MIREMTDLLMPRECLVCGRRLGARESQLCIWCSADLPLTYYWERRHNPMADRFNALLEDSRTDGVPMPYAAAAALLFYHRESPYRRILQALKYEGNRAVGRRFAALLGRCLAAQPFWATVDLVLPVPMSPWRKWQRGYNQAEVLAAVLAEALGAPLRTDVLRSRRKFRSQTALSAEERRNNVAGAFALRRRVPAGHILLVDDTFTTGATLLACHQALREGLGPSPRISVATLAVVE